MFLLRIAGTAFCAAYVLLSLWVFLVYLPPKGYRPTRTEFRALVASSFLGLFFSVLLLKVWL